MGHWSTCGSLKALKLLWENSNVGTCFLPLRPRNHEQPNIKHMLWTLHAWTHYNLASRTWHVQHAAATFKSFPKIRGPNTDTKEQGSRYKNTPKTWTPNLSKQLYNPYDHINPKPALNLGTPVCHIRNARVLVLKPPGLKASHTGC